MPVVTIPIPSTEQNITRPVIYSIIDEIQKLTGITNISRIIYNGDILSPLQAGSSISAIDSSIIASNNNELYIEVEETLNCANLCGFYA